LKIAWEYLERTGESATPLRQAGSSSDTIEAMIRRGTQPAGPSQSRHQRLSTSSIVRRDGVHRNGMLVRLKAPSSQSKFKLGITKCP